MLLSGLLLPSILVSFTQAVWYQDIVSPNGWNFGNGMVLHVEDTKSTNSSVLERIALRMDYGEVEVSAVPNPQNEAVKLNFFLKDQQKGRSSKKNMGNIMIPFWLGAAKGTAITVLLAGMKIMALKSLLLAKVAVIISVIVIAVKYFKKSEPNYIEVEETAGSQQLPIYELPGADHPYAYSPYHAYAPSAVEAAGNYAAVVEINGDENTTSAVKQHFLPAAVAAAKRRDHIKRKLKPSATVLTIKEYKKASELI